MPVFCVYPLSENARSASGVSSAIVNAADAAAAKVRANALRTSGEDPDFTTPAFGTQQLHALENVTNEFLIEGVPLAFGVARRGT